MTLNSIHLTHPFNTPCYYMCKPYVQHCMSMVNNTQNNAHLHIYSQLHPTWSADHTCIVIMLAVLHANWVPVAVKKQGLIPNTVYLRQKYWTQSLTKKGIDSRNGSYMKCMMQRNYMVNLSAVMIENSIFKGKPFILSSLHKGQ